MYVCLLCTLFAVRRIVDIFVFVYLYVNQMLLACTCPHNSESMIRANRQTFFVYIRIYVSSPYALGFDIWFQCNTKRSIYSVSDSRSRVLTVWKKQHTKKTMTNRTTSWPVARYPTTGQRYKHIRYFLICITRARDVPTVYYLPVELVER